MALFCFHYSVGVHPSSSPLTFQCHRVWRHRGWTLQMEVDPSWDHQNALENPCIRLLSGPALELIVWPISPSQLRQIKRSAINTHFVTPPVSTATTTTTTTTSPTTTSTSLHLLSIKRAEAPFTSDSSTDNCTDLLGLSSQSLRALPPVLLTCCRRGYAWTATLPSAAH